ncbi:hypothetical protein ANRL4_01754 [Anaerolineae bacterium]|nr:hypothetical protein ANRL4_01754 [Anaerolineae bacterium]
MQGLSCWTPLRSHLKTHPAMINLISPVRPLRGARLQLGEGGDKVLEGASLSCSPTLALIESGIIVPTLTDW